MSKKRKTYDNRFKAQVVMEVLKGERTVNEIASQYQVIPSNIKTWKKQFLANVEIVFDKDRATEGYKDQLREKRFQIDELYRQIGKLNDKLEFAKKKSIQAGIGFPEDDD